jgi:hypothetical protein
LLAIARLIPVSMNRAAADCKPGRILEGCVEFATYAAPSNWHMRGIAALVFGIALVANALASEPNEFAWVEQRVRELQPTAKEKRFDEIGWAEDIRDALRLAKEHQRPVFLFTHDGRMNIGRC